MSALMYDTRDTEREALRRAIEYAPAVGPVAEWLIGVWTEHDLFVCARCVGRITARGSARSLVTKRRAIVGHDSAGECVTCAGGPTR